MATVFETRLIGNLGKDAILKEMDRGVIAINFPVAHNKNWKDKKTGESKTKTTWINCTIWKKENANTKILEFLKKGTMVDLVGVVISKAFLSDSGELRSEIRLNVTTTNILRPSRIDSNVSSFALDESIDDSSEFTETILEDYSIDEEDF